MLGATLWESVKGLLEKEGINQSGNLIPVGHKSGVLVGLHSRAGESLCSLACVSLGDVKLSFRKWSPEVNALPVGWPRPG